MKHISTIVFATISALGTTPFCVHAKSVSPLHANAIAVNNIVVNQHSAMLNAFNNFGGGMTGAVINAIRPHADTPAENSSDLYGRMPLYGEKLYYGEYGDDGTVFLSGHNGGDDNVKPNSDLYVSAWMDWQHTDDYVKFDKFHRIDSRGELISLGFSHASDFSAETFSKLGGFGGVIVADEDADTVGLSELGEYFGLYYGYHTHGFNIQTAANFGTIFSDAKSNALDKNDLSSIWLGAGMNLSYNFALDSTSVLQPGVYTGYTWAHSKGYKTDSGNDISIDNFNAFELSPSIRAITHVVDGWFVGMSARYVFNFTDGGNIDVANTALEDLKLNNFSEYGLSIEKSMSRFNIAATINRRDGGRTGWNGGVRVKYIF